MKKQIQQAWLIFLLGIFANVSIFSKTQATTTGWNYETPAEHSCFEIPEPDTLPLTDNPTIPVMKSSLATCENDKESIEIIQSLKQPDNITEEEIDPQMDQIIRCPQGSFVHLEANTLVNKSGEIVTEPVKIRVKECYKLKDVIANKLTTTSSGKLIETAGMVEITALSGNDTLSLAMNKDIDIAMPGGAGDGYELFNGVVDSTGNIDWILDENNPVRKKYLDARKATNPKTGEMGVPEESQVSQLFSEDTTCNYGITHYILEETSGKYEMQPFNFIDQYGHQLTQFLNENFIPDKKTKSNACSSNKRISVSLKIDAHGKLLNPEVDKEASSNTRKLLTSIFRKAPVLNRNFFDPVSNGRERLKIYFGDLSRKHIKPEEYKTEDDRNSPWMNLRNNTVVNSQNKKKLSYYVMSSMRLGWMNCDRFTRSANLITLNLDVQQSEVDEMIVVFEGSQSAIPVYRVGRKIYTTLKCIPVNSDLKIVCMKNDDTNPKIFTYRIKAGMKRVYRIKENQSPDDRDPGEEINTPA